MLPEVKALLVVQDRDQKIQALQQDLQRVPRDRSRIQEKLQTDTDAVQKAKVAMQENAVAIKALDLDIATRRDTIGKLKTQQFETKKNDEYTVLGEEVERYLEMIDELETRELELMEQADAFKVAHGEAVAALESTQKLVDEDLAVLNERAVQCESRLADLCAERQGLVSDIDEGLLSLYERLLKTKGSDPVAVLKGSQCGGCHMKVTASTVVNVQAEKVVTQCENCGRILYAV